MENSDQINLNIKCKKCDEDIGGKAYYLVELDCLYDGENVTKCKTIYLCSNCYNMFNKWLNIK
jgi:hypothetical protein